MERANIDFVLNNLPILVETNPDRLLLDVLREDMGLTGTKKGCDSEGLCGGCTVLIDGRARRACRTPVKGVQGKSVLTIEGLTQNGGLHPLQQTFIDNGAVQCGYCTPGMILSAKALLDTNLHPSRDEIIHAIQGNLCRCTGYIKIITAIEAAAAQIRGDGTASTTLANSTPPIGGDARRLENVDRVTGQIKFAGDIQMPGMLHIKILRSPHSSAAIRAIDVEAARRIPGVIAVFTHKDIPGVMSFTDLWGSKDDHISTEGHPSIPLEPVLAIDQVRMRGEAIALVVARSPESALAGTQAIAVEFELWEPIFAPTEALADRARALHATGNTYEVGQIRKGEAQIALQDSDVQVELKFDIPTQEHMTIEPESVVAYIDKEGRLVVQGPTHQPHARQRQIAHMLDIDPNQVHVISAPLGGSFGGRHHFWPLLAAALPAYLLKQPVKLVYTRQEVFEATLKRHAFKIHFQVGASRSGQLTSLRAKALGNAGPYGGAPSIAPFVALCGIGPYKWPAIDFDSQVAHTNWANAGPFRGYGMPQGVLALEGSLDELARKIGLDPWELRYMNAVDQESGSTLGQPFDEPFDFKRVLEMIRPHWEKLRAETVQLQASAAENERYGTGLACNWYQYGKSGELRTPAQAGLDQDGRITLYYTAYAAGAGQDTVISQLASHELGVERESIVLINNDTDLTLESNITGACRTTYWVGGAIQQAVRNLKQAILSSAAVLLEVKTERLLLTGREVMVFDQPERALSLKDIARTWRESGQQTIFTGYMDLEKRFPNRDPRFPQLGHFVSGAAIAQVRVDLKTGKTKVLKVVVAQDVGKALNPLDLEGQIEGSVIMDVGSALMEEFIPGETLDLKRYTVPRSKDAPEIKVLLVEMEGGDGPHGAKGAGESSVGHTRAAIINAMSEAIGARLTCLPATPERVLAALQERAI